MHITNKFLMLLLLALSGARAMKTTPSHSGRFHFAVQQSHNRDGSFYGKPVDDYFQRKVNKYRKMTPEKQAQLQQKLETLAPNEDIWRMMHRQLRLEALQKANSVESSSVSPSPELIQQYSQNVVSSLSDKTPQRTNFVAPLRPPTEPSRPPTTDSSASSFKRNLLIGGALAATGIAGVSTGVVVDNANKRNADKH